jgi:hypothetical protein
VQYYISYSFIRQLYFNTALSSKHRRQLPERADLDLNSAAHGLLLAEFKTAGETVLKSAVSSMRLMKEEGEELASTHGGGLGLYWSQAVGPA